MLKHKELCSSRGNEMDGELDMDDQIKETFTQKYYCVTTSVNNKGHVAAHITNVIEAEQKPESSSTSTSRRDIYNDWFESQEEAENFVEEAKKA